MINSTLSAWIDVTGARALPCNKAPQRAFQGMTPGYAGFLVSKDQANALMEKDPKGAKIIRPYLIGRELVSGDGQPRRWIIDADLPDLIQLGAYSSVFQHLTSRVLPEVHQTLELARRKGSDMVEARADHLNRWWTFWARRVELRRWMKRHRRLLAASRTQRWPFIFEFISTRILPGDTLQLFAFDDDYSFGVLQSDAHGSWYRAKAARLKNEEDYIYSSASIFDTFPWPQRPPKKRVGAVAKAAIELRRVRDDALKKTKGGLRALYRLLELPGDNPLKDVHAALDQAVLDAYGFSPRDDLLQQLLDLNLEVAERIAKNEPVTGPGVPPDYGDPADLITADCVQPE